MATQDDQTPPVPTPPAGTGVPPVEPPPAAPEAPPAAPVADVTVGSVGAPPPPAANYASTLPGYGANGAYAPAPAGPPQGLAIASLVCGIGGLVLSLFAFGFLPALAAVILGHIAQKRQPYARGFWITGLITGYIGIGISVIFFVIFLIVTLAAIGSVGYLGSTY